jgi:hypothetical protein
MACSLHGIRFAAHPIPYPETEGFGRRYRGRKRQGGNARRKEEETAMTKKLVYAFGGNKAEGRADMKDLLGGKGANLAEMSNLGLPDPRTGKDI